MLKTISSLSSASFLSSLPAAPARKKVLQGPQQWLTECTQIPQQVFVATEEYIKSLLTGTGRHTSDTRHLTATHAEAVSPHTEGGLQARLQPPAAQAT